MEGACVLRQTNTRAHGYNSFFCYTKRTSVRGAEWSPWHVMLMSSSPKHAQHLTDPKHTEDRHVSLIYSFHILRKPPKHYTKLIVKRIQKIPPLVSFPIKRDINL